jgi:hypothetical protein
MAVMWRKKAHNLLEIEPPSGEVLCTAGKSQALVVLVMDVTLRVRE